LQWQLTQAALEQRPLHLMLSARGSDTMRETVLPLQTLPDGDLDAEQLRRIGVGVPYSEPVMGEVQAGGPAAAAGLERGDLVLAVDGRPVADAHDLRERIRAAVRDGEGVPMQWQLDRQGRRLTLAVTPRVLADGERRIGRIDAYVGGAPETVVVRRGPLDGLAQGLRQTWDVSALTLRMIGRMIVGEASVKNLSGPLTIADYAGQSVQQGPVVFLGFLALVSVSLGVLNLLPLPMLDGGHLMYYLFEGVTGRPVSDLWLARLQKGGLALLLMLMSLALFNDVARLLGLH
jgi:regulator of sigma E protease